MPYSNIKKPDVVFFDWDGTLVDSYEFLNDAHGHVLNALGFPPFKEGEYKEYFGMQREILYPKIYKDKSEEAKKHFEQYVFENGHKINMINGADILLRSLAEAGIKMGVVSNKKATFIAKEIANFGWQDYFAVVVGAGEAANDKPSADPLIYALEKAEIDRFSNEIWYVGDTENDLACARDAGCKGVLVKGHGDMDALIEQFRPILYIDDCAALQKILVAL